MDIRPTGLAAFDMDGTLLDGRTILFLAEDFGFKGEVQEILASEMPSFERSRHLAAHLKGIRVSDFMKTIEKIPVMKGAEEVIEELKNRGYVTTIITDSYTIVAEYFRKKLGIDRAFGVDLGIKDNVITGDVTLPRNCPLDEECGNPSICKAEILKDLAKSNGIPMSKTVAIGDNRVDTCMIKEAGLGIAFQPKVKDLEEAADIVIENNDLSGILVHIK